MARKRRIDVKGILADPDLRRKLMVPTIQATQAREGIETTREQADRAYYVVTEGERATFFDLERYRGGKGELDRRHETFVRALQGTAQKSRFEAARRDFSSIEGAPLAFQRIGLVAHVFKEAPPLDPTWAIAAQGLATADDSRFVRCWWEIPRERVGRDRDWVPFAKGGEFCRFYADVYLVVCWTESAISAMKRSGRVQNVERYFKEGLTWPRRTQRGFNLRRLPADVIFADKGPAIFPGDQKNFWFILGVANTGFAEYLLQGLMSFGSWEVGVIKRLPIPFKPELQKGNISRFSQSIHDAKAYWVGGDEASPHSKKPWFLHEDIVDSSARIADRLDQLASFEASEDARIQELYRDLNDEVYRVYGISDRTRKIIEENLGDRPAEIIWPQMEGKSVEQKRMEHVWRLLSYVVKRIVEEDEDGIVPFEAVSGQPAIMDRVYRELESLFPEHSISQVEVEIVNELKRKVKGYRSANSIREWLEDVYFQCHVSLYRNRPIFWHIASRQGKSPTFSAFVQYHRFDKNAMAVLRGTYIREAIAGFRREAALASKEGREGDRVEWQSKLEEATELDQKLQMVQEGHHEGMERGDRDYRILTPWKSSEDRPKGWDPDIDDGVKVNIEPLQKAGVLRIAKVV